MREHLDEILRARKIDGLLIHGSSMHNPPMVYMTGVAHVSGADLIHVTGEGSTLFHYPMEREEAAKSGLELRSYIDYPIKELLEAAGGNRTLATALRYKRILEQCGIKGGKIALMGRASLETAWPVFNALQKIIPGIEIVGDVEGELLSDARMTKDTKEIEQIREMALVTSRVVDNIRDFLHSHAARDGVLVESDGSPLTIGKCKSRIDLLLAEAGVENPEGIIFSIGRDAGIPHSVGDPEDRIALGKTIVFDIYPCQAGGGYFYDMTRTWCVGHVPDEVLAVYQDVRDCYDEMVRKLEVNKPFKECQKMACQFFEQRGHATILNDPAVVEGYNHSLGHGVGLNVHERPFSGMTARDDDLLLPGCVITMEPGLYYPSRGMGVRLEDTYYVRDDGHFEMFAHSDQDILIPVKVQL